MQFPAVPGGNSFSVAKGGTLTASVQGISNPLHYWVVLGTSASAPTTFAGFTAHITEQGVLANGVNLTFNSGSSTYQGSSTLTIPPGLPSWTAGQHLWAGLFSTTATPASSDVPDVVLDCGTVVA